MEFSKNPPYDLGQLACVINATIENQKLNTAKLKTASIGEVNIALTNFSNSYQSTNDLGHQWNQMVDILDKMVLKKEQRNKILNLAEEKFKILNSIKKLT